MGKNGVELLRGTLGMLVLRTLEAGPLHGYAVAKSIQSTTDETLTVEEGSLYPALYRMEKRGWVVSEWGTTETGRRAKFYSLTLEGREQLVAELATWGEFASAVGKVLEAG
ncbi:MAG TPA: PadR family transcriptional regulator [Acidobacteriota bacterium]|nr:PadR family transcriptional regulator [Acidobacteriota bacterium]